MGRKSGITGRGYDPRIIAMHQSMALREWNREQEYRMMEKKKMRFGYWRQRLSNAVQFLRTADPNGWERWYDDDANVPDANADRENTYIVEARVMELTLARPFSKARARCSIFIWEDVFGFFVYSKEVGKDALYVLEFETFEAAESFIQGLPTHNCGYGFVLDLLPAQAIGSLSQLQTLSIDLGKK